MICKNRLSLKRRRRRDGKSDKNDESGMAFP